MVKYIDTINSGIKKDIENLEKKIFGKSLINIYESNSNIHFYVYYNDKQIVGYISFKEDIDYYEIYNVAVESKYRNMQIASLLINKLNTKNCYLDVNENNSIAIHLYETNGFKMINRRKNYYGDKDALIYERLV